MAGNVTVHIDGYRELDRALRKLDKDKDREFRTEFAKAGDHIADDAKTRISRYAGAKVELITSKALASGVFVVQNANKVTGKRGDFGALQMRHLVEARADNVDKTRDALEDALDRLIVRGGLG